MEKTTLLRPRLSEKTFGLAAANTVYVFDVPAGANKQTVAAAVAAQFEVTVINVNISNLKGKAKRTVRKGGRAVSGQQSDRKKAYVTLKEGDKLPFFDTPEDKKDKKADKKAAKKEEK
ncbi:MAG TPA: 50S ribosomal protein L23 [Candidatus Pristimantibacillus sp.]|nr:50S ribosomal protein L23 [Candidatus Pristimantibacillus sp.]